MSEESNTNEDVNNAESDDPTTSTRPEESEPRKR